MALSDTAKKYSSREFVRALKSLMPLKEYQIEMLRANYKARNKGITASEMSALCGWNGKGANFHYGKLARMVGKELGASTLPLPGHDVLVAVLVDLEFRDGQWFWTLHPQLEEALKQLKIV